MNQRRRSRELALQILFQQEFQDSISPEQSISLMKESFEADNSIFDYTRKLINGISQYQSDLDGLISASSAKWNLSRMALVDKNILRIAVFEMKYLKDEIPPAVAINEAIEIAKIFGSTESKAFINGILDNIAKELN